ncbi:MAG: heavy-metal-associated domain-containing protein [Flavobacteriales bacterium]|nr:heavy-metal-associated domain-containing protein [Flavobacteriales bacterium]
MKRFFFVLFVVSLFSCSDSTSKNEVKKEQVAVSNETLVTEIEGMVCSMGCGGSIRKELKSTGAVSRVEVDFDEEKEKQTVKITFDNHLISKKEIVDKIEKLNKGQFSVSIIGSSYIESSNDDNGSSGNPKVNVSESSFEIPSLLDILSSIVVQ